MSLSKKRLNLLQAEVTSPKAFDSDSDRCRTLAKRLDGDEETVAFIIGTLAFLYSQVHGRADDVSFDDRASSLANDFYKDKDSKNRSELTSRLRKLLAASSNAESFIKQQRLKVGFLDNAVGFSSFVDIRPMFSKDYSAIESFCFCSANEDSSWC